MHISCENCLTKNSCIFSDLETAKLLEVSNRKVLNTYKKGQTIFLEGNPSFGLYSVNNGKVKLTKVGNEGKESIIAIASSGDILGCSSFFCNENYNTTATALEDSLICFLDKKFINNSIESEPSIAINLIQKLSKDAQISEAKATSMTQKTVKGRLAKLLIKLSNDYGVVEKNRTKLNIKLTREELASMIGTANETVIRFISEFKQEGLIEQEGKTLYILDSKKLLECSN